MSRLSGFILIMLCNFNSAWAALDLVLTQGISGAVPIAITPFIEGTTDNLSEDPAKLIGNDLQNSGRFKLIALPSGASLDNAALHRVGVDSLIQGKIQKLGANSYRVSFQLLDSFKNDNDGSAVLASETFIVNRNELRHLAHHISDIIYEKLTGIKGIFATRIAYIVIRSMEQSKRYSLEIADADGYNPRSLVVSTEPIMSPAWSRDGKRIAYVSFENRRAQIYLVDIATGERHLLTSFPGINGAPAWSPENNQLAMTLSKDGGSNIYIMDLRSKSLYPITHTRNPIINTEPNWSPDSKSLLFTSDQGGTPQIYQVALSDGKIKRLTYNGNYNAHASYSADGKNIVMLHRDNGMYNVAIQEVQRGILQTLTSSGRDESPSLSPNDEMIIYGSEYGKLNIVSTDGRIRLSLPAREGIVKEPIWSPFLP